MASKFVDRADKDQTPLLHDDSDDQDFPVRPIYSPRSRTSKILLMISASLNIVLLIACVFLGERNFRLSPVGIAGDRQTDNQPPGQDHLSDPYSPANPVIEYEYRHMLPNDTKFTGHPGLQWEENMHQALAGTFIRLSKEELELLGTESIPLEGGGYAGGLGVAHNLHCVKKLKMFLYRDYFYPDLAPIGSEFDYIQSHADHCLDFLRQSILCHIDYSVYTLVWGPHTPITPSHRNPGVQKCVNWNKVHSWMQSRSASSKELISP